MNGQPADSIDAIDAERVRRATFVRHVDHFESIASTNDYALQLARQLSADQLPALVIADDQTAGRGRGSNRWWSSAGSLLMSLLVELPRPATPATRISLAVGLAVARALEQFIEPARVGLKWPNDVQLDQRKVCGVLVEQPAGRDGRWVVGLGINVNNDLGGAPSDVRDRAISLREAVGRDCRRQDVLELVLHELEVQLSEAVHDSSELARQWRTRCVLTGKPIELDVYGPRVIGVCEGIDDDGGLVLRTATGRQRFLGGVVVGRSQQ